MFTEYPYSPNDFISIHEADLQAGLTFFSFI